MAAELEGKLADILVVNGNVMKDISILENGDNLIAVMQGGVAKGWPWRLWAALCKRCHGGWWGT